MKIKIKLRLVQIILKSASVETFLRAKWSRRPQYCCAHNACGGWWSSEVIWFYCPWRWRVLCLFGKRVKWASSSLSVSPSLARAINEEEKARERKTILFDIISLVCAATATPHAKENMWSGRLKKFPYKKDIM